MVDLSPTHSTPLAPQFETAEQQALTAKLGMWAFVATEVLFFSGALAGYGLYRWKYPEAWAQASRHLSLVAGTVNTAVLLTSSLTMALAVDAIRNSQRKASLYHLAATVLLGSLFLGIKAWEYYEKWQDGLIPGPHFEWHDSRTEGPVQLFYSLYFALTGMHAFHMIIGIAVLLVILEQTRCGHFSREYSTPVELVGVYWHFVDCVWVLLFPLLYLVDRTSSS